MLFSQRTWCNRRQSKIQDYYLLLGVMGHVRTPNEWPENALSRDTVRGSQTAFCNVKTMIQKRFRNCIRDVDQENPRLTIFPFTRVRVLHFEFRDRKL